MKKTLIIFLILLLFFVISCDDSTTEFDIMAKYKEFEVINLDKTMVKGTFYINKANPIDNLDIPFINVDGDIDYYYNEGIVGINISNIKGTNIENLNFNINEIYSVYGYKKYVLTLIELSLSNKEDIEQNIHIDEISFIIGDTHNVKVKVDITINVVPNYEFYSNEAGSILFQSNIVSNRQYIKEAYIENSSEKIFFITNPICLENDTVIIDVSKLISQNHIIFSNLKIGGTCSYIGMRDFDSNNCCNLSRQDLICIELDYNYDLQDGLIYNYYTILFQYKISYDEVEHTFVYETKLAADDVKILEYFVNNMG